MTNKLRVLSEDEIPCVAGGSIVVTGYPYDPWSSYMSYDQFMWMYGSYYQDPYAGYGYSGGGGSGGGGASAPNYPTGFNQQLDNSADAVAETANHAAESGHRVRLARLDIRDVGRGGHESQPSVFP